MSATLIPSAARMRQTPLLRPSDSHSATSTRSNAFSSNDSNSSAFVDYQYSPFPPQDAPSLDRPLQDTLGSDTNPVPELISDEVFNVLRANDLINEKGIRDHIIRRAFKTMREERALKSSEALAQLQAIYPYLQIDTIRKIIYRIGPGCHRKALL